ncbi:hypothetical protein POSPLADRAFT_1155864 [Postia placenta MAD-698-R-SB12]|uniref:Protein arginine methyltransferase NDUFAF7 n=1 Tax=Postia placenta MAD-698-R-SB12 TaxID=670580 RepID=A0A1X6MMH2_9APHY|nr:hypothetical protein POSPLADRAFT_1155864 [Postia placenta MAD-698-R-SB12]OSX57637.1 hypothetical protein POSPLADRAFT_1155864 [Postia placenta MAD-698-R-SB12]
MLSRHAAVLPCRCKSSATRAIAGVCIRPASVARNPRRTYVSAVNPPVTKVEKILGDAIKAAGPVSFATYMQMCLSHPTQGYYMNPSHPVFGSKGDFTTSPEISQVFGELVGIWLLSQWMHAGNGRPIRLVELGPGRGTLVHDVLRVLSQFPAAHTAIREIQLIETSSAMRSRQEDKLSGIAQQQGWKLEWNSSLNEISSDPSAFTMILAHEFFDALPFHLIQRTQQGWREVLIAANPDTFVPTDKRPLLDFTTTSPPPPTALAKAPARFHRVLAPEPDPSALLLSQSSPRYTSLPVGSQVEVSPAAFKIARRIGELVRDPENAKDRSAGCALIVDYGGEKAYGSSFRAFKDHKIVDVFHRPGECDLTVNVDFAYLKEAVRDIALPLGPLSQAAFLTRMGLQARVEALKKASSDAERKADIERAARRLVDLTGMGGQYQVMGVVGVREPGPSDEELWPFVK